METITEKPAKTPKTLGIGKFTDNKGKSHDVVSIAYDGFGGVLTLGKAKCQAILDNYDIIKDFNSKFPHVAKTATGTAVKALTDENAELKAKLAELEAKVAKRNTKSTI